MRIGEVARAAGLSTRQVRYYTNHGLLPSRRMANGYRDYGDDAADVARRVRELLSIGLTVKETTALAPCLTGEPMCEATRQALRERVARIDEHVATLTQVSSLITQRLDAADAPASYTA